jgi:prepilin-type N-terminal cleavage/methylation domain-containing protein
MLNTNKLHAGIRQRPSTTTAHGFTLFELLVVLAILGALAALAAPRVTQLPSRTTPEVVTFLETERALTVTTGTETEVRLVGRSLISLATGATLTLGDDERITVLDAPPPRYLAYRKLTAFYADGTMAANRFSVYSGDATYRVEISPFSPRIRYASVD